MSALYHRFKHFIALLMFSSSWFRFLMNLQALYCRKRRKTRKNAKNCMIDVRQTLFKERCYSATPSFSISMVLSVPYQRYRHLGFVPSWQAKRQVWYRWFGWLVGTVVRTANAAFVYPCHGRGRITRFDLNLLEYILPAWSLENRCTVEMHVVAAHEEQATSKFHSVRRLQQ